MKLRLHNYPFVYIFLIITSIILLYRIPIAILFSTFGLSEYIADSVDSIIKNFIIITGLCLLIKQQEIPLKLHSFSTKNMLYYLPLLFYILIFSGGFKDFLQFKFSCVDFQTLSSYTLKYLSSAFVEEFLFRGFILGLLLYNFSKNKSGILKSIIIAGLAFGLMHIINLWTIEGQTIKGIFNQVYASTCFGVMYGATYLKTRNIIILGLIHFASNFFASINELLLLDEAIQTTISANKSLINIILSEIFRIIIFGIPLLIGLWLVYTIDEKDLKQFFSKNVP